MWIGFNALPVQDGRGGPATLACPFPHQGAEAGIDRFPSVVQSPFAEDVIDGVIRRFRLGVLRQEHIEQAWKQSLGRGPAPEMHWTVTFTQQVQTVPLRHYEEVA